MDDKKHNGRSTVYNDITSPEKLSQINKDNIELQNDWLEYLSSIDRSPKTIYQYKMDLGVFWVWNLENNNNIFFVDLTKRQIAKFQSYALNTWGWSPSRIRRVKSTLSSLSNYIENILDDEYEGYKPIIRRIENPALATVREKNIITEDELKVLLNTLTEQGRYQAACAIALAAYSGARKAELPRFKVSYFDDENLVYNGAVYRTPEPIKSKGRGKLGKQIVKYTLVAVKPYVDRWLEEREKLGIESEWLLVSKEGDKWVQAKVSLLDRYADKCAEILGKNYNIHEMRHFLTTIMVSHNIPTEVIQAWNQWSSSALVDVYNDNVAEDDFGKYFTADGIVNVEKGEIGKM